MTYLISEHWWPTSQQEIGNTWLEAMKEIPEDKSIIKPVIQAAVWPSKGMSHSISVYSVQPGKEKEALILAERRMLFFASKIEGWEFDLNIALDAVEAMSILGLKPPEV